ncbi:hypothetical protein QU24_17375 [Pantoea rodasii]|uniref:Uncharacterized protein n=2 Tax=Pantoea TaxID=53335 RepID=A0A0U3V9S3_9GAMM|nr:hypothetical protein LK04_03785 [Pantoea vagans]KHJ66816.1 hypothetical protein QU24_17375 [Pantoea rodasii]
MNADKLQRHHALAALMSAVRAFLLANPLAGLIGNTVQPPRMVKLRQITHKNRHFHWHHFFGPDVKQSHINHLIYNHNIFHKSV